MTMFEKRVCAFIDILGFRDAVVSADSSPDFAKELKGILDVMNSCALALNSPNLYDVVSYALKSNSKEKEEVSLPLKASEYIRSTAFSDSLVISSNSDYRGAANLIFATILLVHELLKIGYMVRGAISSGNLYHDENTVFGKALVDAYELETAISIFPRICASDEFLSLLGQVEARPGVLSGFFARDFDGIHMLDYLGDSCLRIASMNDPEQDWEHLKQHNRRLASRIEITGNSISRIAEKAKPNGYRVLAKLRWLVQYYRKSMSINEFYLPRDIELPNIT